MAEDCIIIRSVSISKFIFFWKLLAALLPPVSEVQCNANRRSFRWFRVWFPATRFLEAKTAESFSDVSNLCVFDLFSWHQLLFSNQVVNGCSLHESSCRIDFRFVSLRWKPNLLRFSPSTCNHFLSRYALLSSKIYVFVFSVKMSIDKIAIATSCLSNKLSDNAWQFSQRKPKWPNLLKKVLSSGPFDKNIGMIRPNHTRCPSKQRFQFLFRNTYLSFF